MSRPYYFQGVELLQEFPEEQSYFEQTGHYPHDFESSRQPNKQEPYQPMNLGKDLFLVLQTEYKQQRKVTTYSEQALFDIWKVISKAQVGKPPPKQPSKEPENELIKKQLLHKKNLHFWAQANSKDVQYTLKCFCKDEQDNANISKYIEQRQSEIHQQEQNKIKKDRKMSKDVSERLFPKQLITQSDDIKSIETKKRQQFVENVIKDYRARNPTHKDFKYPDRLKEYWNNMGQNKEEGKPEDFDLYFQDSMEQITDQFFKFKGFQTDDPDEIIKIWRQTQKRPEITKYDSEANLKTLLTKYLQAKKDQENINLGIKKMQMEQSMKKKKLEVDYNHCKEIAKPKDRLKVGKTLLELKKMYPNDKILRKMLLQEFRDTKVAKYPLEYDVVDSDEENKQKMRHLTQKTGLITLEEMELPNKMKVEEISELFERHMELYYSEKQTNMRKEDQSKKQKRKQEFLLKKYIEQMAKKYLELRKRRLEEKIPTINEYLSTMYKHMLLTHKEVTLDNFPHLKYGESKKLKKKSFPSSLKRYFFGMMKSYVRRKYDYVKDQTNRIGFWVPTNGKSMCVAHKDSLCPPGCNRQTLNQRVIGQSRLVKEAQLFTDRPKTSVWDSDYYSKERCNIMMTFSDAKECTFQPAVCYRMPEKLKKIVLNTHNWAQTNVGKSGTIQHFLSQFGENFKKVPTIYRYGIFKRSQVIYRKGDYRKSYQLLALCFNIWDLKLIFRDSETKQQQKKIHPIFNAQNMGIDDEDLKKVPHENLQLIEPEYQNKPEYKFLLEVYLFVKQLENYEEELYQSQNYLKKMLKQDNKYYNSLQALNKESSYNLRKITIKDQMCPLGLSCPSIQTRWPNSNISGITPLGAECMFAHHPYELRFRQELKARKSALKGTLKAVTERLGGNQQQKAWNPGGNTMRLCIGCPENALCSECQMKKKNIATLEKLQKKAKKAYQNIKNRKHFQQRRKIDEKEAQNYNIKLSCLSRANALYLKERYSEAFEVILKAIEIVKQEIEIKEKNFEESQTKLKQQLELDADTDITIKQVFESSIKPNPDDKQESQKLHMYAKRTHLNDDPEPDTRQFINKQIELLYRKIELKLQGYVNDIQLMKEKINKIEDKEDIKAKSKNKDLSMKMCPNINKDGQCKNKDCTYCHNYLLLDLEPTDSKLKSLQESIKHKETSLRSSKPPIPWVQSGVKDAEKFNDTAAYDKELERKRVLRSRSKSQKQKDISKNDLYSQDIDDIKAPIYERKKKQNF